MATPMGTKGRLLPISWPLVLGSSGAVQTHVLGFSTRVLPAFSDVMTERGEVKQGLVRWARALP